MLCVRKNVARILTDNGAVLVKSMWRVLDWHPAIYQWFQVPSADIGEMQVTLLGNNNGSASYNRRAVKFANCPAAAHFPAMLFDVTS